MDVLLMLQIKDSVLGRITLMLLQERMRWVQCKENMGLPLRILLTLKLKNG